MSEALTTATVRAFYDAFGRGDATAMNACYATDIVFTDPVFATIEGDRPRAMWTMLCAALRDFSLTYEIASVAGDVAVVDWIASYTYTATGRPIRNIVRSTLTVHDGRIVRQTDRFDLWRWSAQALGPVGTLLGWSPQIRQRIRATAAARLAAFESKVR